MTKKEVAVKIVKYRAPMYLVIPLFAIWTFALVGCHIIPTHYTTNSEQENLAKQNSLLQIEFLRRFEQMDEAKRLEFLCKNVEFAIAIEEIISGEVSESHILYENTKKDREELDRIKEEVLEGQSNENTNSE